MQHVMAYTTGHNEDEAPFWSNHTYIVHANVTNMADGISSVYTGFGSMCHAMHANES